MPAPDAQNSPWEKGELPEPPPFSTRNLFKVLGPGIILLSSSIGGGEWLAGPATAVQYGVQLMWIATVGIVLQVVFNLEALRYTLYTGEPIYGGFLRLAPGRRFWASFYCLVAFLQLAWPAMAGSSAATLFASFVGRLAGTPDTSVIHWIATGLILVTLLILCFGGTIEKMLERVSYFMMAFVFLFLVVVNVVFIPLPHWWTTLTGFFSFSGLTSTNTDWVLLAALAATAGSGGMGNLCVTSWARDKGFGMARHTGAIPSAVAGRELKLSPVGKVFAITSDNLRRWNVWQRYIRADQIYLWGVFAFIGMFLNVNLATGVIPPGTPMEGMAMGAHQAKFMADTLWQGFWFLALLNGFWILYGTHLGNTDILVRTVTDILWMGSSRVQRQLKQNVARLYYLLLGGFTLWAVFAVRMGQPFQLFKLLANMAGFIMIIASFQICRVNRKFLPKELRSRVGEVGVVLCGLFYLFFTARVLFK